MAREPIVYGADPPAIPVARAAPLSVLAGSLLTIIPVIATFPLLPPFGLLLLLGWRLQRPHAMKPWTPALLGFFDDLVSGQPLGSATFLWGLCSLGIDLLDTRLVWRDMWQDWLLATGAIAFCLVAGRLIAAPLGAHVDTAVLFQAIATAALFPLSARFCAWLDRRAAPR